MVKFVVVVEERDEAKRIHQLLEEVVKLRKEIVVYESFDKNLEKEILEADCHKTYIIDICFKNESTGINIAHFIRKTDYDSEIIFICESNHNFNWNNKRVCKVYDFIEKNHEFEQHFKKDIQDIIHRKYDHQLFEYETNGKDYHIFCKNILYIYRDTTERKLIIVTNSNRYKVNMCIKDMLSCLEDRFVQCHRSCIVNAQKVEIRDYKKGYFILDNGEKVYMLSKKYKDNFDQYYVS